MGALNRFRSKGFQIRLADDKIGITPFANLTETQRSWISEHRDTVLDELREESANESANIDVDLGSDRWQSFVDLAVEYGVTPEEVVAEFSGQDISDLLEEPDVKLPLHAKTIADVVQRNRLATQVGHLKTKTDNDIGNRHEPSHAFRSTPLQTCGDCQNFVRTNHPNLGHCSAGEPEAPAGLWDGDGRGYCQHYQAAQS
jgi:hypothetical protein